MKKQLQVRKTSMFFCSTKTKLFKIISTGFGTFGKKEATNKFNEAIEEIAEDLESQHVKEVMGISEFGRKAKSFDITVIIIYFLCAYAITNILAFMNRNK